MVFLDDETPYLEMLAIVLPRDWCIRFYTRMDDYLAQINAQALQWEEDVSQHQDIINQWYKGKQLPVLVLDYWRSQSHRYGLPSIAVVDYAMPAANGLEVLKASPPWPPHRVLLTGKADEHTAVAAFNDGLIDRYVTKQTPDLAQQLVSALRQHYNAALDSHESIWRNILRRSQQQALHDRAVQQAVKEWLKAQHCVEYVVIPEPFGLLALDAEGHAHWLQFELHKDLAAAVDLAQAAGHDAQTLAAITQGQLLSDAEWCQALGASTAPQCAPAMAWGPGGYFLAAHFPQNAMGTIGIGHRAFLADLPERGVDLD
ncbi:MAG: response regulator [Burkholderiales bacterium]|nr:MAG: response regulator [Burkholderiales bacterium]